MRSTPIVVDEIYHIYNRGNQKQTLFRTRRDYIRMLFLVLYFQSPHTFRNIARRVHSYEQTKSFDTDSRKVVEDRYVELINFCLMPNHFHMTIKNISSSGISLYLQRVQNAYGRYFNIKHEKSGHVFQGAYKSTHISTDTQLQHLSAYIHKNPTELSDVKNLETYCWSSYQDYIDTNRWGRLLQPDIILDGYKNQEAYEKFVKTSSAKAPEIIDGSL